MSGINRAISNLKDLSESRKSRGVVCVFLSHQQRDKDHCRKIAEYLLNAGVDVYFDENDEDLKFYRQSSNPAGVVNSIRKGINNSSHMLVVISPNTIDSKWVPWEVGYGYDHTDLGILTLKGIGSERLPEYLHSAKLIRGTKSLNDYVASILPYSEITLLNEKRILSHTMGSHPLDNYLDWKL